MGKPEKQLQLLRGARLALQHFTDWSREMTLADATVLIDVHDREFRHLPFLARRAYDRFEPTSDLRERVCR
jgi:hypothetical protein